MSDLGLCTGPVYSSRWLFCRVCRQDLPWLLMAGLAHHESWVLVAAWALLVFSRTVRRVDRALGRTELRRMRDA